MPKFASSSSRAECSPIRNPIYQYHTETTSYQINATPPNPISRDTPQSSPTRSDHPHQTFPRPSNPNQAPRQPGQPCSSTERRSQTLSARHTLREPSNERGNSVRRSGERTDVSRVCVDVRDDHRFPSYERVCADTFTGPWRDLLTCWTAVEWSQK